ncbi:MAG: hypothetical protein RJA22_2156 [Verrucomicrobiota bacterium]|jgi:CHAD domain-containing protein
MSQPDINQLIIRMESYLECWKQFNSFMSIARTRKFTQEDENQFLEVKSVLTQELELLLSNIDCGQVSREDVHNLIAATPSIRYLSELNENSLRNVETSWHKLFIAWQSILGQLKVQQASTESRGFFSSLFGRRAA